MSLAKAAQQKRKNGPQSDDLKKGVAEVTKEPIKRLSIELTESRHHAFKLQALKNGEKMRDAINRMIENYLNN